VSAAPTSMGCYSTTQYNTIQDIKKTGKSKTGRKRKGLKEKWMSIREGGGKKNHMTHSKRYVFLSLMALIVDTLSCDSSRT